MDKEKCIAALKHIGALIISTGLAFAAFAVGIFTANGGAWEIACFVFGAMLVAVAIANIAGHIWLRKHMTGMRVKEGHDFAQKVKSEIESDYDGAEKKVRRTILLSYAYAVGVITLLLLFCFSLGRLGPHAGFTMFLLQYILTAVGIVMMWGVVYMFFAVAPTEPPALRVVLDKAEYPQFYAVAKSAAAAAGCGDFDIVLYDMTDGISVTGCGKTIYINLDYAEAAVLTRDELFNVMLHEFAHVVYDFKRGRMFRHAISRTSGGECTANPFVKLSMYLFFSYPGDKIRLDILMFDTVSSRSFEQRADDMIIKAGDKQTYADACAKIDGFFQYSSANCREIAYDFYEPEQPVKGFASRVVEMYYTYREKYADVWKERMLRELPANVATHPTSRMRLDALGVTEFDAARVETDPAYTAEIEKLLKSRDDMIYKRMTEEEGYYEKFRKGAYVMRKAVMDKYLAAEADGEPSEPRMLQAVRAFIGIDDDKALEIVEKALALNAEAPRADFLKGVILFDRYDPECVACFKRAAKYPKLAEEAYDRIGRFALKSGDEALLAEYRADVCDIVQTADDMIEKGSISNDTKLLPHDLDESEVRELVESLTERCEGISKIYIAKYVDGNGVAHYPVYVTADHTKLHSFDEFGEMLSGVADFLNFYSDAHDLFCYYDFSGGKMKELTSIENAKVHDIA